MVVKKQLNVNALILAMFPIILTVVHVTKISDGSQLNISSTMVHLTAVVVTQSVQHHLQKKTFPSIISSTNQEQDNSTIGNSILPTILYKYQQPTIERRTTMKPVTKATLALLLIPLISAIPLRPRDDSPCESSDKPHHVDFYADDFFHGVKYTVQSATDCCVSVPEKLIKKVSSFDTGESYCNFYSGGDYSDDSLLAGGLFASKGKINGSSLKDEAGNNIPLAWNDKFSSYKCIADPDPTTPSPQKLCEDSKNRHDVLAYTGSHFSDDKVPISVASGCCLDLDLKLLKNIGSFDTDGWDCNFYSSLHCIKTGARDVWPGGWMQMNGKSDGEISKNGQTVPRGWNDQFQSMKCTAPAPKLKPRLDSACRGPGPFEVDLYADNLFRGYHENKKNRHVLLHHHKFKA